MDDLVLGEPSGEVDELDLGESPASEDGLDDLDIGGEGLEELDLGESGDGLDDLLDDKPAAADSPEELPQLELDAGEESLDLDSDSDVQLDSDMEALDLSLDEDSLGDLDAGADAWGQESSDESLDGLPAAESENRRSGAAAGTVRVPAGCAAAAAWPGFTQGRIGTVNRAASIAASMANGMTNAMTNAMVTIHGRP